MYRIILLLVCSFYLGHCGAETAKERQFNVGVISIWGYQQAFERWQPLMEYLNEQIPNTQFHAYPGDFDALSRAMELGDIQFIITNPSQYLFLSKQYPLSWLATMRSRRHNGSTTTIGSAIVVRADSEYQKIADLRGKAVAAIGPQALGGYQAANGLIHKLGYEPNGFFSEVKFLHFPLEPLVYQVRDGNVAAAITPLCTLEGMAERNLLDPKQFRILHSRTPVGFDCDTSTRLYPNFSFATSINADFNLNKSIARALMTLPPEHPAAVKGLLTGWTSPISQLSVIQLYDDLRLDESGAFSRDEVEKWLMEHRYLGVGMLLLLFIAMVYHAWIQYRFHQKSAYLVESERNLKQQAISLERLRSAAIIGEIGSGLAHEINQPIAAITSYSEGGIMRLKGQSVVDSETSIELLEKIHKQSTRAGEVVHRIRSLLKRRDVDAEDVDIQELLDESITLLRLELKNNDINLVQRCKGSPFVITADRVGLLQVLINLIKNGIDAIAESPNRHNGIINIDIEFVGHQVNINIIDNGVGLPNKADTLMATFYTTKENGLGIGLAICKEVIKQNKGLFTLTNRGDNQTGCCAYIGLIKKGSSQKVV
ncbi:sensor histidine kinase [Shewanella youngdeokensis]|uniref:histidine kinase n=1 Tax=Shewanella youngdeokensis TaxID=2999068 RepID=A0ABZ0JWZ3_9GAMM|nr:PhnD/SsuA/transferrin family substrate-binding protein [Shewanella sp. DAU334]